MRARLMAMQNEVTVLWAPAHKGISGNEFADGLAKEGRRGAPATSWTSPTRLGGRPAFRTSPGRPPKSGPETQHSGSQPMSGRNEDTSLRGVVWQVKLCSVL